MNNLFHIGNPHLNPNLLALMETQVDRYDVFLREIEYLAPIVFKEVALQSQNDQGPEWRQGFFTWLDALCLCSVLKIRNPINYVEIGSGNSTRFARWCIDRFHLRTKITSIDPSPRVGIDDISDKLYRFQVQEMTPDFFCSLEAGDVLFYDGSHQLGFLTDMTFIMYYILPILHKGVMIGTHDTYLPFLAHNMEDYTIGAMLLGGSHYMIDVPSHYLASVDKRSRARLMRLIDDEAASAVKAMHYDIFGQHGKDIHSDMHGSSFYFSHSF